MSTVLIIAVLYTGFGLFLSRFLPASIRNCPLTWIFLTVTVFPLWVHLQALFIPWHAAVTGAAVVFAMLGVLMSMYALPRTCPFDLPPLRPPGLRELCLYAVLLGAFLMAVFLPKLSLIQSPAPSIGDDVMRVQYVASVGIDLDHPVHLHAPSAAFSYPYFDSILPAILFRTMSFSAQEAWFIHTILRTVGLLGFLLFVALSLLHTIRGRCAFLLSCTFLGGFDVFVYRFAGFVTPSHVEWWGGVVPLFRKETFQISSPYTLFLWVPSHLLGACIFVLITILALRPSSLANRIMVAILFACLLGFSAFVFVTAAASYAAAECILWMRGSSGKRTLLFRPMLVQVCIFTVFALRLLLLYHNRGGVMWPHVLIFRFLDPAGVPGWLLGGAYAVNAVLTVSALLWIDMGIVALFGIWFFCQKHRSSTEALLRKRLAIACIVTVALVFSFRSITPNDFFMRGITVLQMSLAIATGIFVERLRWPRYAFWVACVAAVILQTTNFSTEFAGRTSFRHGAIPDIYAFIRDRTPTDAVIMTVNEDLCDAVSLLGNRICPKNFSVMNGQERSTLGSRPPAVPRTIADIIASNLPPHAYLLTTAAQASRPGLRPVFDMDGLVLSEILQR